MVLSVKLRWSKIEVEGDNGEASGTESRVKFLESEATDAKGEVGGAYSKVSGAEC